MILRRLIWMMRTMSWPSIGMLPSRILFLSHVLYLTSSPSQRAVTSRTRHRLHCTLVNVALTLHLPELPNAEHSPQTPTLTKYHAPHPSTTRRPPSAVPRGLIRNISSSNPRLRISHQMHLESTTFVTRFLKTIIVPNLTSAILAGCSVHLVPSGLRCVYCTSYVAGPSIAILLLVANSSRVLCIPHHWAVTLARPQLRPRVFSFLAQV